MSPALRSVRWRRSPFFSTFCSCNPARIPLRCSGMRSFRRNRQKLRPPGPSRWKWWTARRLWSRVRGRPSPLPRRRRQRLPRQPGRGCPVRSSATSSANWYAGATMTAWWMASMAPRPTPRSATSSRPPVSSRARNRARRCCRPWCARRPSSPRRRQGRRRRRGPLPGRAEAAVERPAPSKRVVALQRALAEYGYGQIRPSGIIDAETQSAIEKFERERKLPITGQASDRVVRELAAMTGRPLE